MNLHELTRDQLIALARQQATALEACQDEADARVAMTKNTVPGDHKRRQYELDIAADRAARLRREALAKGGRA